MEITRRTAGLVALGLGIGALAATTPALAAPHDRFEVDSQFYAGPSSIVHASGVFAGCTLARDLFGTAALDGQAVRFLGVKRLTCTSAATVLLEYDVRFDPDTGATAGTWRVDSSTLEGLAAGTAGGLVGDPGGCTAASFAGGCILETFTLDD